MTRLLDGGGAEAFQSVQRYVPETSERFRAVLQKFFFEIKLSEIRYLKAEPPGL
jgi:hypothetical protein